MAVNDKKQRIFQIAFSSAEEINALTQTEINQIVERIVAKYKFGSEGRECLHELPTNVTLIFHP